MSVPLNVRRRLSSVIKKFRFEELESTVLPNFPETTWNRLRARLVKHHESFNVSNALRIIEQTITDSASKKFCVKQEITGKKGTIKLIKLNDDDESFIEFPIIHCEANVSEKSLKERLATLELLAVSRHHTKKVWYAFMMTGEEADEVNVLGNREIQARIVQNFRIHQMEMDVRISSHDGITFISMRDKPRGKEAKRMTPVFFALFMGHQYLFCSKKSVTKECITVLVDSLGYTGAKKLKLMGRDLKSLVKMLWMKKQETVDSHDPCESPNFGKAKPVIKESGINFRQNKQRREYVERCFGEEPPTLESLVAAAPEEPWKDPYIASKLPDEKVKMRWEFRSHNIAATLTKLTEQRVFVMPLPPYVANLMKTGKNELKIQQL